MLQRTTDRFRWRRSKCQVGNASYVWGSLESRRDHGAEPPKQKERPWPTCVLLHSPLLYKPDAGMRQNHQPVHSLSLGASFPRSPSPPRSEQINHREGGRRETSTTQTHNMERFVGASLLLILASAAAVEAGRMGPAAVLPANHVLPGAGGELPRICDQVGILCVVVCVPILLG